MPSACFPAVLRVSMQDMVFLNVRTRGLKKLELPGALYHCMPMRAMAMMSTIPYSAGVVSIPGRRGGNAGYPILSSPPLSFEGFVIEYERRANGRYEADCVRYQASLFEIAEFVEIARQWVEQNTGSPKAIPGRYAYFAPSRDEWGVIQRDSGYTAWDPSWMPSGMAQELRDLLRCKDSSGIVARIPVYRGGKQSPDDVLPAFSRVEMTFDADPGPEGVWIGFEQYRTMRVARSRLPDSIVTDFGEWLVRLTEESGFKCWIFHPGMLFGDHVEWWGAGCRRRTEHEGIDFAKGQLNGGGTGYISEGLPVRSIADGEVAAILDDFLGKTIVVCHSGLTRANGDVFHTFLSHVGTPVCELGSVLKGQILGRMGQSPNDSVPPHLHLTGAWLPAFIAPDEISLDTIHPAYAPVSLANFRSVLLNNSLCCCEELLF